MNAKNVEYITKQLKNSLSEDNMARFQEKLTSLDDSEFYSVETTVAKTKRLPLALFYSLFLADPLYLKPVSEIKEWMIIVYLALVLLFPPILVVSVVIMAIKFKGLRLKVADYNSNILQSQLLLA